MTRKLLAAATLLLFVATSTLTAQVKFQELTPDELIAKATKEQKLAFVDIYATWCPPCKEMEAKTFPDKSVGALMDSLFVATKYNVDKEIGSAIMQQFRLQGVPTYLIFSPKGELITTASGFIDTEKFKKFLTDAATRYQEVTAAEAKAAKAAK